MLFDDLVDQYDRLRGIADGQLAFIHGVTEYYRAPTDTKMTIAAERLAVIAAFTLPITALSSMLGMNVIVNTSTHWVALGDSAPDDAGHVPFGSCDGPGSAVLVISGSSWHEDFRSS